MSDSSSPNESAPAPLRTTQPTPRWKRLAAGLILGGGGWLIAKQLGPSTPREVEVSVRLASFRDDPADRARAVTLSFERNGDAIRAVTERFAEGPPGVWRRTLDIPEGDYAVTATIELPNRAVRRTTQLHVAAGTPVEVPPPRND